MKALIESKIREAQENMNGSDKTFDTVFNRGKIAVLEELLSELPNHEPEKILEPNQLCPKCNGDGDLLRYNSPEY